MRQIVSFISPGVKPPHCHHFNGSTNCLIWSGDESRLDGHTRTLPGGLIEISHTHTRARTHRHTHTLTCTHTHTDRLRPTHRHTLTDMRTHSHRQTHTQTHTKKSNESIWGLLWRICMQTKEGDFKSVLGRRERGLMISQWLNRAGTDHVTLMGGCFRSRSVAQLLSLLGVNETVRTKPREPNFTSWGKAHHCSGTVSIFRELK